jgi:type VI secretion system protein ImpA
MPVMDFAALARPVSDAEPCGPDLDVLGDTDYLNCLARADGVLPASYFEFDATSVDFQTQFDTIAKLLGQSRDIRLLVVLAKLLVLNRDLPGFSACMAAIADLLGERWDDVHPRPTNGDATARMLLLQSLDDLPAVILPLQYAPLAETERRGPISYRSAMIAGGEVKPRDGEQTFDAAALDRELAEVDLDRLKATRDNLVALRDAIQRIHAISVERVGYEQAQALDRLPQLVAKMLPLVNDVVVRRDPAAAIEVAADEPSPGAGAAAPAPRGRIRSFADATAALAAVGGYFSANEPSSPALLLVRQAEQLVGKSFVEVMRILVPTQADQIKVQIGGEQPVALPFAKLSELVAGGAAKPAAPTNGGAAAADGASPAESIEVKTRQDAIGYLDEVGAYYRIMEPSSPIPLLTERARGLAERDFLKLLGEMLPETPAPPAKK